AGRRGGFAVAEGNVAGGRRGCGGRRACRTGRGGRRGPGQRLPLRGRRGPLGGWRGARADHELAAGCRDRQGSSEGLGHLVVQNGELVVVEGVAAFDDRKQGGERRDAVQERGGVLGIERFWVL